MNREQKIAAFAMRIDGYAYQEIANKMGTSRQSVRDCLHESISFDSRNTRLSARCVYPNILKYMRDHKMNLSSLANAAGLTPRGVSRILEGENLTKTSIDKILKATGMTYDEAFWREENEAESDA